MSKKPKILKFTIDPFTSLYITVNGIVIEIDHEKLAGTPVLPSTALLLIEYGEIKAVKANSSSNLTILLKNGEKISFYCEDALRIAEVVEEELRSKMKESERT